MTQEAQVLQNSVPYLYTKMTENIYVVCCIPISVLYRIRYSYLFLCYMNIPILVFGFVENIMAQFYVRYMELNRNYD